MIVLKLIKNNQIRNTSFFYLLKINNIFFYFLKLNNNFEMFEISNVSIPQNYKYIV